ncbi:hypothetical protein RND81_03G189900 [Saponaria officinalis]|uniref:Uncharacterized protein n=1 Tax=Saponaria officinalis TaxID=3572 RepID=A0AAW1M9P6_SAPOF
MLSTYGGSMSIFDDANNVWSYKNGACNMRYIQADSVADFNVRGQLSMSSLEPGRAYKGTFELELTSAASGWPGSFSVALNVPGSQSTIQPRAHSYNRVGSFRLGSNTFRLAAPPPRNATLGFSLSHTVILANTVGEGSSLNDL